jgi:hypothetical protein
VIQRKTKLLNNANMELKNVNPNGKNVVASNCENQVQKLTSSLFFLQNVEIVHKTQSSILFTSLVINIE